MKSQFEQHIKQSLENFEAEYNPADWSDMQHKLSNAKIGKHASTGKVWMVAASVVLLAGLIYYFNTATTRSSSTENATTENKSAPSQSMNPGRVAVSDKKLVQNAVHTPIAIQEEKSADDAGVNKSAIGNNSTENDPLASKNTVPPVPHNPDENKTNVQDQPQKIEAANNALPAQPVSLKATFHTDINKICAGSPVQFKTDNTDFAGKYEWYFGDGESSAEQSPKHIYTEAGTYTVKLRLTSVSDRKSDEKKSTVTVFPVPSIQVNYTASEDNNLLINFETDADKVTEWKWDFGDTHTSLEQNPSHAYSKKGTYKAVCTAKSSMGCATSVAKEVVVKSSVSLFAPNSFSPDGNGTNDTWIPVVVGDKSFSVTVFDKFNKVVYSTTDKNNPWDGHNAKVGDTFIWKAMVKDKNGDESYYQGLITIAE
jgi:gliding motility-associated-like protein